MEEDVPSRAEGRHEERYEEEHQEPEERVQSVGHLKSGCWRNELRGERFTERRATM